jgi:catechol 2,3-dioxygenase-like lactoylglutathione lyase family enzyme
MMIERLDHLVLTVQDIEKTVAFYSALGMARQELDGRVALHFGSSKINLHQVDHTIDPKAAQPTPGSADLCFISDIPLDDVQRSLERADILVELGPVERNGALGTMDSVYVRDPDSNLIEISRYRTPATNQATARG